MPAIEIACDESGFSGTNLLDPNTPVITHAALDLGSEPAAELLARVRSNARRPHSEYKSTQLLRRRPAIECLLEALDGHATVHLTDKRFFVVQRLVDFLIGEPTYAAGTSLAPDLRTTALSLHRDGPTAFGTANWYAVLNSFLEMMRTKRHRVINRPAIDTFFEALNRPLYAESPVIDQFRRQRSRVEEVLTTLIDERSEVPPPLEPMLTALVDTTLLWSAGGRTVDIVHDEQSALTVHRINRIRDVIGGGLLRGFEQVDSRVDPRVQVADLLAGVGRHLATQELDGCGDPGLTALLRPYVAASSLWADVPSWRRLGAESKCDEALTNR